MRQNDLLLRFSAIKHIFSVSIYVIAVVYNWCQFYCPCVPIYPEQRSLSATCLWLRICNLIDHHCEYTIEISSTQHRLIQVKAFSIKLISGSCHLDSALNDEFSVECLFWFFQPTRKSDLKAVQITKNYIFCVNAPLSYLECAPNCKTWLQLKKITATNISHSTSISTFDVLSKWH